MSVFLHKCSGRSHLSLPPLADYSPSTWSVDKPLSEQVYYKCELHSARQSVTPCRKVPVSQRGATRIMGFGKYWARCGPPVRGKPTNGRQIASMSAWRVIFRLGPSEPVHRGQRRVVICFGFRARVYHLQGAELVAVETNKLSERKQ